jgi:hypothetical protein
MQRERLKGSEVGVMIRLLLIAFSRLFPVGFSQSIYQITGEIL